MVNKLKVGLFIALFLNFFAFVHGAHFVPGWQAETTNAFSPMTFTVTSAVLDIGDGNGDVALEANDEIAVFDGNTCVGAGTVSGTISAPFNMLDIVASAQDPDWTTTVGFTAGNNPSYRFWDSSAEVEILLVDAILADGSSTFAALGDAEISLTGTSCEAAGQVTCTDDGSCVVSASDCSDDDDGDGVLDVDEIAGCMTSTACNYNSAATDDDGSCISVDGICETCVNAAIVDNDADNDTICNADEVSGCMDSHACNYNGLAEFDDGSCANDGDGGCDTCSSEDNSVIDNDADNDGICDDAEVDGCMTSTACNYSSAATDDDGSCVSATGCDTCSESVFGDGTGTVVDGDTDDDGVCDDLEVDGCTNVSACNYNSAATDDNGSCQVPTPCDSCASGLLVTNGSLDGVCETCVSAAIVDNDTDNDTVCDANDGCAETPAGETADENGCAISQLSITNLNIGIPTEFAITQNYPNPFNPITNIVYALPKNSNVTIEVFDISGKWIQTLIDEFQTSGYYSVNWNASEQSTGMYILQLTGDDYIKTKKITYLK